MNGRGLLGCTEIVLFHGFSCLQQRLSCQICISQWLEERDESCFWFLVLFFFLPCSCNLKCNRKVVWIKCVRWKSTQTPLLARMSRTNIVRTVILSRHPKISHTEAASTTSPFSWWRQGNVDTTGVWGQSGMAATTWCMFPRPPFPLAVVTYSMFLKLFPTEIRQDFRNLSSLYSRRPVKVHQSCHKGLKFSK